MRGKKAKAIRKLLVNPDAGLLVLINKVYGDKTKNMNHRQVYQALKKMFKMRMISFKKGMRMTS
jgi:hypothetical protein